MTDLSSRALLISLNISQWEGRRFDREVTDQVNTQNGAAGDAGRYNKALIDPKEMLGIGRVVSATRSGFVTRTLPWMNDGTRIANAASYIDLANWVRDQRALYEIEVAKFLVRYPTLVMDSKTRLSGMFKDSDYPTVGELRGKFTMSTRVMPVPNHEDFRVDISTAQADELRREIEASVGSATDAAVKDVFDRITEVAKKMVDRLPIYKPGSKGSPAENIFRDSLVDNVRDLAALLPSLNITADPRIDEMTQRLKDMASEDADVLRNNQSARQDTAAKAQDILNTIGDYFG